MPESFRIRPAFERNDVHALFYCLEHGPEGTDVVTQVFHDALKGKHHDVAKTALNVLRPHFAPAGETEDYCKEGPVAVAKFELGEDNELQRRALRAPHQREVSEQLLVRIGY